MPHDNLFDSPDMVVSLLVPNMKDENVAYKYLKELAKGFVLKSNNPTEFVQLINTELSHETSRTRRQALSDLRQRAMRVFALDE